ncbi:histidine phosphatase family protein [Primorskyibacter sp. S187A]|uniref:histidine phosphatase family protein n=1 Tax=Primorskyibacter sp. S187A TaxID=3415130 RepID=UPI003C7B7BAA
MTIYLIRHAQSAFNAVYDRTKPDPMIFDAPITDLGETQALRAREAVQALDIEQVIVSPLTRTLQTAHLIFGQRLPVRIDARVREQLTNSCDVGRTPQELAREYPHHDFDHLETCWWHDEEKDHRGISVESDAILQARADAYAQFLQESGTRSTAIVTHGNFIRALTGIQPDNCDILPFDPRK